ncbi:selenium binding protein [Paenibacillus aurantius]|uniref:Selenium binding protein n=1 Tax=Paenibacillus aurantius TaxID=2918900 RepID=A0AA96LES8_9BACL|nr:selenium binding protein [Paenibacillus aurantius]WNQ12759.1 selenium binding protein [Paenibacillus aurantius]
MYEDYSRQSLPPKKYRELLGSAICVFNSNNAFIIENILRSDDDKKYNWYELIDKVSGKLTEPIKETITKKSGEEIASLFDEVFKMRNRIIHSFQVTHNDEQILATKYKDGQQIIVTEEYLYEFIKKNEQLSDLLEEFRQR